MLQGYTDRCVQQQTPPHLEDLSIGVQDVDGHFNVLLDALPSSLKVSALQRQVQVVTDVTWDADGRVSTQTYRGNVTAGSAHTHTQNLTHS